MPISPNICTTSYFDIRQANDVERRPHATHIRVAVALDGNLLDSLSIFAEERLAVGGFAIEDGPPVGSPETNRLIGTFGSIIGRHSIREHTNQGLHTVGATSVVVPKFVIVFVKSEVRVIVADFDGVWWRLISRDLASLREPEFKAESWQGSILNGDTGRPQVRYDPSVMVPCTADGSHALSTLEVALAVPGVKIDLTLGARSILILDNRRMLIWFPGGGEGEILLTR